MRQRLLCRKPHFFISIILENFLDEESSGSYMFFLDNRVLVFPSGVEQINLGLEKASKSGSEYLRKHRILRKYFFDFTGPNVVNCRRNEFLKLSEEVML